jgi:hypothetical protein
MRKFVLSFFAVFLFSCVETYSPVVNNESSQTVTFTLTTGYRTQNGLVLQPSENYIHEPMPVSLESSLDSFEPADSVNLTKDGNVYTFSDIPILEPDPVPAFIYNTLSKDVILSGDGAISPEDPITINAGEEITVAIIKDNPSFSAITTDGYPVAVDYIFNGDDYKLVLR